MMGRVGKERLVIQSVVFPSFVFHDIQDGSLMVNK